MPRHTRTKGSFLFAGLIIVESIIALVTFNVTAKNMANAQYVSAIASKSSKIRQNKQGTVLGVAKNHQQAIDLLPLLLQQADNNRNYTPLLVMQNDQIINKILNPPVNLLPEHTPAFVFYDKQGQEIKRVLRISSNVKPAIAS